MEIINSHAHIYPNKIAEKATNAIGEFYNINMNIKAGTPENLLIEGEKINISKYIVHSVATKPSQVRSINEFILEEMKKHEEFVGFMTLHQDLSCEEIKTEINWAIENGFKGIKLHPDFQKFDIDSEKACKIYGILDSLCQTYPVLLHMGDKRYEYSRPKKLLNVAKKYKNITFIAAHLGGYSCWEEVDCLKGLNNVFFDTSSSLAFLSKERAKELIYLFGVDKIFFGDDFPMWHAKEELKRFKALNLSKEDEEKILSLNIKKLLNI